MNLQFPIYDLRLPDEDAPRLMGVIESSRFNVRRAMRCYTPGGADTPSIPDVGNQYTELLNAMITGMPATVSAAQTYGPQLTEAQLGTMGEELTGTATTPGYLSLYQNQVAPAISATTAAANTAARTANLNDLTNLGPAAVSGIKALDPATAGLSDALTKTTTDQLNLGTQLDPNEVNNISKTVQGNWANRGLGASAPAGLDEAMQLLGGGQNLLAQREGAATGVINQNMTDYTEPLMQMLGINSPAGTQAQNTTTTGSSLATGATAPESITTNDLTSLLGTTYNANAASNISNANNASAICGSAIGAGGSILGGAGGSTAGGGRWSL